MRGMICFMFRLVSVFFPLFLLIVLPSWASSEGDLFVRYDQVTRHQQVFLQNGSLKGIKLTSSRIDKVGPVWGEFVETYYIWDNTTPDKRYCLDGRLFYYIGTEEGHQDIFVGCIQKTGGKLTVLSDYRLSGFDAESEFLVVRLCRAKGYNLFYESNGVEHPALPVVFVTEDGEKHLLLHDDNEIDADEKSFVNGLVDYFPYAITAGPKDGWGGKIVADKCEVDDGEVSNGDKGQDSSDTEIMEPAVVPESEGPMDAPISPETALPPDVPEQVETDVVITGFGSSDVDIDVYLDMTIIVGPLAGPEEPEEEAEEMDVAQEADAAISDDIQGDQQDDDVSPLAIGIEPVPGSSINAKIMGGAGCSLTTRAPAQNHRHLGVFVLGMMGLLCIPRHMPRKLNVV